MKTNLFDEIQPAPHVETRVKFVVHGSSLMLCGEGWIQPRGEEQPKDITIIKVDRPTLFEASEHGVESENLTDQDLLLFVKAGLIAPYISDWLVYVLEGEYEVLG
jgi:hypothetical protein